MWTREVIALRRASFAQQLDTLAGVFTRYKVQRCCLDQSGMGEAVVEQAQARHGKYRVEGVLFTNPAKQELATVGKQADGLVRIPIHFPSAKPPRLVHDFSPPLDEAARVARDKTLMGVILKDEAYWGETLVANGCKKRKHPPLQPPLLQSARQRRHGLRRAWARRAMPWRLWRRF